MTMNEKTARDDTPDGIQPEVEPESNGNNTPALSQQRPVPAGDKVTPAEAAQYLLRKNAELYRRLAQ